MIFKFCSTVRKEKIVLDWRKKNEELEKFNFSEGIFRSDKSQCSRKKSGGTNEPVNRESLAISCLRLKLGKLLFLTVKVINLYFNSDTSSAK